MIPTSDGSRAQALFSKMDPKAAEALRVALVAAIAKAAELCAEVGVLAPQRGLDVIEETQRNATPIENTAMDVFADTLAVHSEHVVDVGAAIAAGTVAAVAGGVSLGKVRHAAYRAGSVLGDVEAVASGNPEKIVRRGVQHVFWRAFGKAGRSIFRMIGGGR
jgi:hypothetical protein